MTPARGELNSDNGLHVYRNHHDRVDWTHQIGLTKSDAEDCNASICLQNQRSYFKVILKAYIHEFSEPPRGV